MLFTKGGSLWVAWIKAHWLKKCNYWTASRSASTSWTWRSLLTLRPIVRRFLTCRVGDGEAASFWYDAWSPLGPLIEVMGDDGPRRTGITRFSTVAEACNGSQWCLPQRGTRCRRMSAMRGILSHTWPPNLAYGSDKFVWGEGRDSSTSFSTKKTWEVLRHREERMNWADSIWFRRVVPKQSFLAWVVTLNRLPLRTRLIQWGVTNSDVCCVCNSSPEDRDHLFLNCDFALQIWEWLRMKLNISC